MMVVAMMVTMTAVQGREADMRMTSVSGHLLNMEFAPEYRKWSVDTPADRSSFDTSQLSPVTSHLSPVTCHISPVAPRYSCQPQALFDAPIEKCLGGNNGDQIKKTLVREVGVLELRWPGG